MVANFRTYAELRQEVHDALRAQHPEWIQSDGESPICNFYEERLAELLASSEQPLAAQSRIGPRW